ncbi:hypothetical protein MAUB1S_01458 [Mycolicibacterium aubagnense]
MTDAPIQWFAQPCPAADPAILTQPRATVVAACIAVVAALIAYAGVTKTVRSARRESRRKERADALIDGLASLQAMARMVGQTSIMSSPSDRFALINGEAGAKMNQAADAWTLANGKLVMYGMRDVLKAAEPFIQKAQLEWAEMAGNPVYESKAADVLVSFNAAVPAFKNAMKSLK